MPANLLTALDAERARPGFSPLAKKLRKPQPSPTATFKLNDGQGLKLEVRPTGKKVWRYRYRVGANEQTFTIGDYGDGADEFTLEGARIARAEARRLVKQGIHPKQQRAAAKALNVLEGRNTFLAVAEDWYTESAVHWAPRYAGQVRAGLDQQILPAIGDRPIRSITSADLLPIIKGKKHHATSAILLQQWMGAIFRYAIRHLYADSDPTYAVRGVVKRAPVKHRKPIPRAEIPAVIKALKEEIGSRMMALALRLLMLTFVRPGEVGGAKWAEFDLDGALWRIPAERMKKREPHLVPLSSQALEVLRELEDKAGKSEWLLPSSRNPRRPVNERTMAQAMERIIAGGYTPHGFRATASTILNEMGFASDLIERQLAHSDRDKTRASYNHAQFLERRAEMMQNYADLIDATSKDNVVPIKKAAKK